MQHEMGLGAPDPFSCCVQSNFLLAMAGYQLNQQRYLPYPQKFHNMYYPNGPLSRPFTASTALGSVWMTISSRA